MEVVTCRMSSLYWVEILDEYVFKKNETNFVYE